MIINRLVRDEHLAQDELRRGQLKVWLSIDRGGPPSTANLRRK